MGRGSVQQGPRGGDKQVLEPWTGSLELKYHAVPSCPFWGWACLGDSFGVPLMTPKGHCPPIFHLGPLPLPPISKRPRAPATMGLPTGPGPSCGGGPLCLSSGWVSSSPALKLPHLCPGLVRGVVIPILPGARNQSVLSLTPLRPALPPLCSGRVTPHPTACSWGSWPPNPLPVPPSGCRSSSMKHTPELDP